MVVPNSPLGNFEIDFKKCFDLITVGKILLSLCFIAAFLKMPKEKGKSLQWILKILAKYSFSIFFLHQLSAVAVIGA